MVTKNNQSKSKQRGSRQYPIDFVVPLQLEECVHRIEHSKRELFPDLSHYSVELKILRRLDHNRVMFNGRFYKPDSESYACWIEGTLTRWQGTSTRFIGKAHLNYAAVKGRLLTEDLAFYFRWMVPFVFSCSSCGFAKAIPFDDALKLMFIVFVISLTVVRAFVWRLQNPSLPISSRTVRKTIEHILLEN